MRRRKARKHIGERTLRAATIIVWLEVPHEIAKEMTEDEVLALVEYDHYPIRKADGGPDLHWNLRPMLRDDHKTKTKHDASDMAHERKVRKASAAHESKMLQKFIDTPFYPEHVDCRDIPEAGEDWFKKAKLKWPKRKIPSRPFRRK